MWLSTIGYWLLMPVLLLIAIEDVKHRGVRWWFFLLMALMGLGIELEQLKPEDIVLNTCFVMLQLAMLTLYFSIKEKKLVNIAQRYLGLGDVVFWLVSALLFSSLNFIFFFMGSLTLTMLVALGWRIFKLKPEMSTVPLAGIQSLVLLGIVLIKLITNGTSFRSDEWIGRWLLA